MTDKALATARELVDGAVCECGHTDAEHVFGDGFNDTCNECEDCDHFRPVHFLVERRGER